VVRVAYFRRSLVGFKGAMNAFLKAYSQLTLVREEYVGLPFKFIEASRKGYVSSEASTHLAI
jgi:hypothetical protein